MPPINVGDSKELCGIIQSADKQRDAQTFPSYPRLPLVAARTIAALPSGSSAATIDESLFFARCNSAATPLATSSSVEGEAAARPSAKMSLSMAGIEGKVKHRGLLMRGSPTEHLVPGKGLYCNRIQWEPSCLYTVVPRQVQLH